CAGAAAVERDGPGRNIRHLDVDAVAAVVIDAARHLGDSHVHADSIEVHASSAVVVELVPAAHQQEAHRYTRPCGVEPHAIKCISGGGRDSEGAAAADVRQQRCSIVHIEVEAVSAAVVGRHTVEDRIRHTSSTGGGAVDGICIKHDSSIG